MRSELRWVPFIAALVLGALVARARAVRQPEYPAGARPDAVVWGECRVRDSVDSDAGVRCGVFTVLEDPAQPRGRVLQLRVAVLSATGQPDGGPPVLFIAGGPGATITDAIGRYRRHWLRDRRDLLLIDQRGTSEQMRLDCSDADAADAQRALATPFDSALFARCVARLSGVADLRRFTTEHAVRDLDAFRKALSLPRVAVFGTSYGTRVALHLLRRHPESVDRLVLLSVVPPEYLNPLQHAPSAQWALDELVRDCAAEERCRAAYPRLGADLARLTSRLRTNPAEVQLPDGSRVRLSVEQFGEALRVMMYTAEGARRVPYLLAAASKGDLLPFAERAVLSNAGARRSLRLGLLQAVVCSEDIPLISDSMRQAAATGTLIGDSRVREQKRACAAFPRAEVPRDFRAPVAAGLTPVLAISGTRDPVTPPEWGWRLVRGMSRGRHLEVPGGHAPDSPCLHAVIARFLSATEAERADFGCVADLRAAPFEIRRSP